MNNPPRAQNQTTRRQHYVWRHYLEAWQFKDDITNCLRDQRIFPTNPTNIMVERDFYKLSAPTQLDTAYLDSFLKEILLKELRDFNRFLIQLFGSIPCLNEVIQRGDEFSNSEKQAAQAAVIEIEERLHGEIERQALPILDDLRKRNDFINDQQRAFPFCHFLAHQYMRTKRTRESLCKILSKSHKGHHSSHLTNLLAYCIANNIATSRYRDRDYLKVVFLETEADFEFITGDQPIVNLMDTRDGTAPKEVAFYYPLTPNLAMILLPKMYQLHSTDTTELLPGLNDAIAWESRQFLVAKTPDLLQCYQRADRDSRVPPRWQDLVDQE